MSLGRPSWQMEAAGACLGWAGQVPGISTGEVTESWLCVTVILGGMAEWTVPTDGGPQTPSSLPAHVIQEGPGGKCLGLKPRIAFPREPTHSPLLPSLHMDPVRAGQPACLFARGWHLA